MSIIRVDNFGPSAGGTTYSARGIAKAWVNFNGTGTIAARDSENVSSLTDVATGRYTVSVTSSFNAADYSLSGSCADAGKTYSRLLSGPTFDHTTFTASATAVIIYRHDTPSYDDMSYVFATIHGDLA